MSENLSGILNVYKPQGLTSHAVVSRVRKFYGVKRVGHAGTLDPLACGRCLSEVRQACKSLSWSTIKPTRQAFCSV